MSIIKKLVSLANKLDSRGLYAEAEAIDDIIKKIAAEPAQATPEQKARAKELAIEWLVKQQKENMNMNMLDLSDADFNAYAIKVYEKYLGLIVSRDSSKSTTTTTTQTQPNSRTQVTRQQSVNRYDPNYQPTIEEQQRQSPSIRKNKKLQEARQQRNKRLEQETEKLFGDLTGGGLTLDQKDKAKIYNLLNGGTHTREQIIQLFRQRHGR